MRGARRTKRIEWLGDGPIILETNRLQNQVKPVERPHQLLRVTAVVDLDFG